MNITYSIVILSTDWDISHKNKPAEQMSDMLWSPERIYCGLSRRYLMSSHEADVQCLQYASMMSHLHLQIDPRKWKKKNKKQSWLTTTRRRIVNPGLLIIW